MLGNITVLEGKEYFMYFFASKYLIYVLSDTIAHNIFQSLMIHAGIFLHLFVSFELYTHVEDINHMSSPSSSSYGMGHAVFYGRIKGEP